MPKIKSIYEGFCKCDTIEPCGHQIQYLSDQEEDYGAAYMYEQIICINDEILELNFVWTGFKVFHKIFDYLFLMPNLITLIPPGPCEKYIPNKIALMQNLNYLDLFDYDDSSYRGKTYQKYKKKFGENDIKGYYIYKDKMLIYYATKNTYIPSNIRHINITYYPGYSPGLVKLLNNLPFSLEHLHLNIDLKYYKNYNLLSNLPISLKSIKITLNSYENSDDEKLLLDAVKIPFDCRIDIENIKFC